MFKLDIKKFFENSLRKCIHPSRPIHENQCTNTSFLQTPKWRKATSSWEKEKVSSKDSSVIVTYCFFCYPISFWHLPYILYRIQFHVHNMSYFTSYGTEMSVLLVQTQCKFRQSWQTKPVKTMKKDRLFTFSF